MPGTIWSHQLPDATLLSIIRVSPQTARGERFVLLLDNRPVMPPFVRLLDAMTYVAREWVTVDVAACHKPSGDFPTPQRG